ncbi:hypothetical protein SLEP1_g44828 [Rubroshorea leprosula]|uniref:PPM-type phosphatase domain-containing protein n=1 Tax=Rubroshorea leprosula TaxID=152421 RepID=A0AAV5LIL3_9ROSI|nr:hypothetical protein SLEP1_g44828 [Rubroshorea leprosula]
MLASLSTGNHLLKEIIIPEPEITITEKEAEDEFLILASDGLSNVFSDARACEIVSSYLRDETLNTTPRCRDEGRSVNEEMDPTMFPAKTTVAASILTKLALP